MSRSPRPTLPAPLRPSPHPPTALTGPDGRLRVSCGLAADWPGAPRLRNLWHTGGAGKETVQVSDSYPCPCCGHRVLGAMPGSDKICPVCFREDDVLRAGSLAAGHRWLESKTSGLGDASRCRDDAGDDGCDHGDLGRGPARHRAGGTHTPATLTPSTATSMPRPGPA
ncbi:CPCC family cysteine-rich protein [Streptomyces sp. MS06]|uniref:CPCC family cysteine-rich protein n=1 Tax=Streptomyces sp. MS06 TaxID=3385974 RepID=UPI00399FD4E7